MSITEPEAVIIAALITAVFAAVTSWVAARVQRKRSPQRRQTRDAWVNDLIERICAVYERQIAFQQDELKRRERADERRDRADDERYRSAGNREQPGREGTDREPPTARGR